MLNAVKSVLADVSSVSQSVSQSINQSVNQSIKWLIGVCVMLHTWCLLPNLFKFLLKISTLHTKLYTQNHLGGLINNSYSSYMYLTIPNYLDFLFQTTNIRSNYLNFFWEKEDETSFFFTNQNVHKWCTTAKLWYFLVMQKANCGGDNYRFSHSVIAS